MKTFGPKVPGQCLQCQAPLYEVRAVWPDGHPLAGQPKLLGPALESQTQVVFLLSDGSEVPVTFCLDCARALEPADYWPVWRACVARNDLALQMAGHHPTARALEWQRMTQVFPLAIVARRVASPDGLAMLDRR